MFGKKPIAIVIGERGADHVLIEPHSKMVSGRFEAEIFIRCGTWSGHLVGIFVGGELHKFGQDISNLCEGLKCTAVLKPNEPRLQMTLNGDRKNRSIFRCEASQGRARCWNSNSRWIAWIWSPLGALCRRPNRHEGKKAARNILRATIWIGDWLSPSPAAS